MKSSDRDPGCGFVAGLLAGLVLWGLAMVGAHYVGEHIDAGIRLIFLAMVGREAA
jgi:hypothetical protein